MDQLLVTTGATVAFPVLLAEVLSVAFLQAAIDAGFGRLVVQYGPAETLVRELAPGKLTPRGQTLVCSYKTLQITLLAFDANLVANYTAHSRLVVSHAGTGSIMDTLRGSQARLLVVANTALKDNHQLEIGHAFHALGALQLVTIDQLRNSLDSGHVTGGHVIPSRGIEVERIILERWK